MMSRPSKSLHTIGYEGMDIRAFIDRLSSAEVQAVVDVRELPLSRKKGFSKTSFREVLSQAGIGYFHMPVLGCPKDIRDPYKASRDWEAYTRSFLAYLGTQEATVRELARLAKAMQACLVCFEADYAMCHRTYVARAARKLGGPPIVHLMARTAQADSVFQAAA